MILHFVDTPACRLIESIIGLRNAIFLAELPEGPISSDFFDQIVLSDERITPAGLIIYTNTREDLGDFSSIQLQPAEPMDQIEFGSDPQSISGYISAISIAENIIERSIYFKINHNESSDLVSEISRQNRAIGSACVR
ncbi:MAG: hypothetical protein ACTS1Z_14580 [Parasphingopyxis sp.]